MSDVSGTSDDILLSIYCKTIGLVFTSFGSCGSNEKVRWLVDELKIDYVFNYRKLGEDNISSELRRACPNGIDLYFDNVGGKYLEAAIDNMNIFSSEIRL